MKLKIGTYDVAVNMASRSDLLAAVRARFTGGQGFALATINLDHLVKLRSSGAFRDAYSAQDFVVADGNPIVWLSRLGGVRVELIPGSEMVLPLARLAVDCGVSIALVGSTDESLSRAGAEMKRLVPGLQIVAEIAPPFGFDPAGAEADEVFAALNASGAGLAFLALGAPKQEILAARGRELAPQTGFASIGAGLDFLSGSQTRAPAWVQSLAMEWAWRMITNPVRLVPRYAQCFAILPGHIVRAILGRLRG